MSICAIKPARLGRLLLAACLGAAGTALAEEPQIDVTLQPARYAWVDGDVGLFRAHHWMKEGAGGGIRAYEGRLMLPGDVEFFTEGHALWHDHDLASLIRLRKEALGFIALDFSEFRKYYDDNGGVYRDFASAVQRPTTDKDLALDIGEFNFETGLTLPDWPELTFAYGREYRDGAKSRLTWTPMTDGAVTRNIGPAWQDIDEIADSFALGARHSLGPLTFHGEQRWEFVRSERFREERSLSTNSTASQKKIRRQDQAPESTLMTTTLGSEGWFWQERLFFSNAYHYAHLDNREFETLLEFNEAGVLTAFSSPKMQINARAANDLDSHTWVANVQGTPLPWLTLGTKLKSELVSREGNSMYPEDAAEASAGGGTPDGVIDRFDNSLTDNRAVRWGEAFSVRVTALPRTALYSELEFEQARARLREDRVSIDGPDTGNGTSSGEVFNRDTVTNVRRGAWTLGAQAVPWPFLTLTSHVRHRRHNNDYDDQRETSGSGSARSAFIDRQHVNTDEFMARFLLRPCRWFRTSVRYQFRDDDYATAVEREPIVKTGTISHVYTYDVTLQPRPELLTTASFSRQDAFVHTPAVNAGSAATPNFNADVHTWLLGVDYTPRPPVTLNTHLLYTRAANFDESFLSQGLPLGADFDRLDVTSGVQWAVREATKVGVEYAFYRFHGNENAGAGDYDAHVLWLDATHEF